MRPSLVSVALLAAIAACKGDSPPEHVHEPMRAPAGSPSAAEPLPSAIEASAPGNPGIGEDDPPAKILPQRPRADPDIERTLDLIAASGLRFVDPPADPRARVTEYTAEQFASMLRSKWDWIGYDLTELDPWLEEIATRSFKTNIGYRVVHADGTSGELREWLDARLRGSGADERD
jgi:hypothetical protein